MNFENKVVLITGASRGIGKAIALLFAEKDTKIVINYLTSKEKAEGVVNTIKELGSDAIAIQCDISKENEVQAMIQQTIDTFGTIDILVNNAGIVFDIPFFEKTVEQWKQTMDTNLLGTFLCSKYAAKIMKEKKTGTIINISSTNGTDAIDPVSIEYGASKAGIIYFTKALAKELAPYIRVNTIAPGWVDTDMNKDLPKKYITEEMKKIYLRRMADPKEMATVVLFLASDDASYVNGTIIKVDGGYD